VANEAGGDEKQRESPVAGENSMEKASGRLVLTMMDGGTVQMAFTPNGMHGNPRPLLAKDMDQAESDLVATFEFSQQRARTLVIDLKRERQVDVVISIDEGKVPALFQARKRGS
jgi:hypothetical protein